MEQIIKSVHQIVEEFYLNIDSFDEKYSICKYDKAIIKDAISSIRRIESIRQKRDKLEH